jgi:hypothetical protein
MNKFIRDLVWTALVSGGLAFVLLAIVARLSLSFPLEAGQRPVFILGIILFSLVFRLMMHVRGESK